MSAGRICVREVDLADPEECVQVAASRMHSRNVGTLIVLNDAKQPIGILTDRDLAVRVVAEGRDPYATTVSEIMTEVPVTVAEDTPIEQALGVMRAGPYRRVPVVDNDGALVGLLSVDDVMDLLTEEFNEINRLLQRESPKSLSGV
jgi:CBS domain-containing protein